MAEVPKIDFAELKRTHLGFPSEWKINNLRIHFRYGRLTIFVDDKPALETGRFWIDDDLDGYLSDEDLKKILLHHELLR